MEQTNLTRNQVLTIPKSETMINTSYFIDLLTKDKDVVYIDDLIMCKYLGIKYSDRYNYKRACIYARFSSQNQQEQSITAQVREILEKYCKPNKVLVTAIYMDFAKTGTNDKRNGYQLMCKELKENLGDKEKDVTMCLLYRSDRQARNVSIAMEFFEYLKTLSSTNSESKALISITEPEMFQDGANSKFLTTIKLGFNSYYSDQLSELVKRGIREKAKRSYETYGMCSSSGGKPVFGYDVDPKTKLGLLNELESNAVKTMFEMFVAGATFREIKNYLDNESGCKPRFSEKFSQSTIHDMLRNQKYIGVFIHNARTHRKGNKHKARFNTNEAEIYENAWPRIIDDETFQKAQDRLDKRANDSSKKNRSYNLTRLITCGTCGCSITGRTSTRKKPDGSEYRSFTYKCNNKNRSICNSKSISLELLEDSVLDVIQRYFFQKDSVQKIVSYINDRNKEKNTKTNQLALEYHAMITDLDSQIDVAVNTLLVKNLSDAVLTKVTEKVDELETEKNELVKKLEAIGGYGNEHHELTTTEDRIVRIINEYKKTLNDDAEKRNIFFCFVSKIRIHDTKVEIDLDYKPFITSKNKSCIRTITLKR